MILNAVVNNPIPIKPVYLLYGSDVSQLLDSLTKIKHNFPGTKKYYFLNFNQFSQFYHNHQEELFNRDLFCLHEVNKIIEIYLQESQFNKIQQNDLEKFLEKVFLAKNICLILFIEKSSKNFEKSKLFQLLNKQSVIIVSKKLSINEFKLWLNAKLQVLNLKFTPDALSKFIEIYQHNLLQAKQVISNLSLYYNLPNNASKSLIVIDLKDLMQHIDEQDINNTLFDLQNSLIIASLLKTVDILNNLKQQSIVPILVLWSIIQAIKKIMPRSLNTDCTKYANLLAKAAEIDLAIKYVDHKLTKLAQDQYIWGLILDLCICFVSIRRH